MLSNINTTSTKNMKKDFIKQVLITKDDNNDYCTYCLGKIRGICSGCYIDKKKG